MIKIIIYFHYIKIRTVEMLLVVLWETDFSTKDYIRYCKLNYCTYLMCYRGPEKRKF